jgi:hypothetical protein
MFHVTRGRMKTGVHVRWQLTTFLVNQPGLHSFCQGHKNGETSGEKVSAERFCSCFAGS